MVFLCDTHNSKQLLYFYIVVFLKGGRDLSKMRSVQLLNDYRIAVELDNGSSCI